MKNTRLSLNIVYLISLILFIPAQVCSVEDYSRLEMDAVGLYNPLGLSFSASAYYRDNYQLDDSILWRDLYWQPGIQLAANPAYQRIGFHLEWVPVAVVQTRFQYDRYYFTGTNGTLLAFNSDNERYGDDEIEAREGQEESGYGNRYLFNLTLRAKFGNVIVRNVSLLAKYEFPGAGPYYLEREYELLMATTDYLFSNQLYVMYEDKRGDRTRYIGPYYDYVKVRGTELVRERLGMTLYQEISKPFGFLQRPRWYLQAGVYLTERNRQDEVYLVMGFGGDYDF